MLVGGGQGRRARKQCAVAFAQLCPLDGEKRFPQQCFEFGKCVANLLACPDGDDHHGHARVAAEELCASTLPACGAVNAEKH